VAWQMCDPWVGLQLLLLSSLVGKACAETTFMPVCQIACCDMEKHPRCKRVGCNARRCMQGDALVPCGTKENVGGTRLTGAKVTATGGWKLLKSYNYFLDHGLVEALVNFFQHTMKPPRRTSVLELGAGMGCYTAALRAHGIDARGVDGAPGIDNLTSSLVGFANLAQPQQLELADWVYSFEVGEHIPRRFESNFLWNLVSHARLGLVLSWSLKSSAGRGHVNARNTTYLIETLSRHYGLKYLAAATDTLRRAIGVTYWIGDSIMVFKKVQKQSH